MAQATGGKRKTYGWWYRPPDTVICYEDPDPYQTIARLWEAAELTEFHDAALAQGTAEINTVLKRVERNNRDRDRKLSFIRVQNRLFLVWARYGSVGPENDETTVIKALKLKVTRHR